MKCINCNTKMKKKSTSSSFKWLVGLAIIVMAIPFVIMIPPFGAFISVFLLWIGNRLQKGKIFFYCKNCGHKFDKN